MNVTVQVAIFLKEDLCTFGCQKEGLSGNDENYSMREKTTRSQRMGKGKCLKGTGKRRTILEMRKIVLHLKLEKI